MREPQAGSARVGVQELRRNLSVYLDRVREGERLVVTEHGRAVAELGPLTPNSVSVLERLVAEGRARGANGSLADLDLPPDRAAASSGLRATTSDLVIEDRSERSDAE